MPVARSGVSLTLLRSPAKSAESECHLLSDIAFENWRISRGELNRVILAPLPDVAGDGLEEAVLLRPLGFEGQAVTHSAGQQSGAAFAWLQRAKAAGEFCP